VNQPVGGRVSCSEFSFPSVPDQASRIGIVKLLGFEAVDIGLFAQADADLSASTDAIARDLDAARETHGVRYTDLFFVPGATFEEIAPHQRDPHSRERGRLQFAAALAVAAELEVPGMTLLPGAPWPEGHTAGWDACAEELRWRVDEGARRNVSIGVEAHIGSIVSTPELALAMIETVPGLQLTLDLSHFDVQDIAAERALALAPHARHVHVRASMPGAIQVRWSQNEAPLAALVEALENAGYDGCYCVEYVPMPKWRCDEMDVVSESVATQAALAGLGVV
jgi:sugar phosphate isomerase/epimerase